MPDQKNWHQQQQVSTTATSTIPNSASGRCRRHCAPNCSRRLTDMLLLVVVVAMPFLPMHYAQQWAVPLPPYAMHHQRLQHSQQQPPVPPPPFALDPLVNGQAPQRAPHQGCVLCINCCFGCCMCSPARHITPASPPPPPEQLPLVPSLAAMAALPMAYGSQSQTAAVAAPITGGFGGGEGASGTPQMPFRLPPLPPAPAGAPYALPPDAQQNVAQDALATGDSGGEVGRRRLFVGSPTAGFLSPSLGPIRLLGVETSNHVHNQFGPQEQQHRPQMSLSEFDIAQQQQQHQQQQQQQEKEKADGQYSSRNGQQRMMETREMNGGQFAEQIGGQLMQYGANAAAAGGDGKKGSLLMTNNGKMTKK